MLTVKVVFWDSSEDILECEHVSALAETLLRPPGVPDETPWYSSRTVMCYNGVHWYKALATSEGFRSPDEHPDVNAKWSEKRNTIYVMNDKGRTIATYV
jgi:hypothetical protein